MLSQQQLVSSSEEQRTVSPDETRSPPAATSPRRPLWRTMLGVALPVVAATAIWWIPALWSLWSHGDVIVEPGAIIAVVIVTRLLTFAGGALLRSRWALLIVPAAWAIGEMLTTLIWSVAISGLDWLTNSLNWAIFWPVTGLILAIGSLPVLICAGLGVLFGRWLQRRGR